MAPLHGSPFRAALTAGSRSHTEGQVARKFEACPAAIREIATGPRCASARGDDAANEAARKDADDLVAALVRAAQARAGAGADAGADADALAQRSAFFAIGDALDADVRYLASARVASASAAPTALLLALDFNGFFGVA